MEDRTMEAVTGVFKSRDEAEKAVDQLRSLGIPEQKIGILSPGAVPERLEAGVPVTDSEDPGMGPVIAFGMVGAALLGVVGAAAGSAVGDTVEEELGEGVPHEDIYFYEDALRQGHSIV